MTDKFYFHIFIDNSTDLENPDHKLVKDIVKKLGPAIEPKAEKITLYYLQPDAGPAHFDVPKSDPKKLEEKIDSLNPGKKRVDFDQMAEFLKDTHFHKPRGKPHSIIYITNGAASLNYEKRLSKLIDETMVRVAARNGPTIQVGERLYRPCGITFVLFGEDQEAKSLLEGLDTVDSPTQKKLEECLKHGSDELYNKANDALKELQPDEKQYYCKKTLDIVDYVEVKDIEELDERKLEKIMLGAIDPNLDNVDA
ncbi:hypothetical protein PG984_006491 [Apiospora sp. TS-2023a]